MPHSRVFLIRVLCILTRDFGSLDVEAGLILELHLLVVAARVEVGRRVLAHLSPPSFAVAEGEWASEGTLYEVASLSEHGVKWCIAGDHVAEGLHGLDVFLAIACKEARSFAFVSTAFISRRTALRRLCGTGVKVRHAEGIKNGLVTRASMGRRQKGGTLLEFFEKVQDSPIFILSSSIGFLWTLARDFFKTRTKNTLRLAGLKAKVYTFMLYGMW